MDVPTPTVGTVVNDSFLRSIILRLFDIGALKFGRFTLKSGIESPVYVDLRLTISYPSLLRNIADALLYTVRDVPYDIMCGVPYTALPFATAMSIQTGIPMVMRRKEAKAYGTKRIIEGSWKEGQTCLVVEDLVTSGLSIMETVAPLQENGLAVTDVVVLLDRQQNARRNLEENRLKLHSVFSITQLLDVLVAEGKIGVTARSSVLEFVAQNQASLPPRSTSKVSDAEENNSTRKEIPSAGLTKVLSTLSYGKRAEFMINKIGKTLLELMEIKKTNLAVAADVTTTEELINLANSVGPYICVLKTHADIISDWTSDTARLLQDAATKHNFLLFEDRKFADIGSTAFRQVSGGVHRIADWAHIVNAHAVPGPGVISGLTKAMDHQKDLGLLLLAEMSSEGNFATALPAYKDMTLRMAENDKKSVFGFISMGKIAGDDFVYLTPGVSTSASGDALGQQYTSPEMVIGHKGSDVIIVGRGIYEADNQTVAAQQYRDAGWRAYEMRCKGS